MQLLNEESKSMKKSWRSIIISPKTSIFEAIRLVEISALQIALVLDENGRLLGTVTDGDVRRGILKGLSMEEPVAKIMFTSPAVASIHDDEEKIFSLMRRKQLGHIPVVDDKGRVVDLKVMMNIIGQQTMDNHVILMAGGSGTRLRPLTNDCPKALLKVGGKFLLETILDSLIASGFHRFYVSINYKAGMIEDFLGNGSKWNVEIDYLREGESLGTAGALSLLPERPKSSFLVMNTDLLTKVDFKKLMDFHTEHKVHATMAVREYDIQVPFGVVKIEGSDLAGIDEKPLHRFFVNAGIYVLEPDILDLVPQNQFFNMTDLFELIILKNLRTTAFPIREYWLDIGEIKDFKKANGEYHKFFG